jgi:hypothetical protein
MVPLVLLADGLPPGPGPVGDLRRGPDGQLITISTTTATPTPVQPALAPAPGAPPKPRPNAAPPSSIRAPPAGVADPAPSTPHDVAISRPAPCPTGAVTCVEITQSGQVFPSQPVTFGQAFKRGDVAKGAALSARDALGQGLALQIDQRATYSDGSLRFAVLSTEVPDMKSEERRAVSLRLDPPSAEGLAAPGGKTMGRISIDLKVHTPQLDLLTFGNRKDYTPGLPFAQGETVTLRLAGDPSESFVVTVDKTTAGGGFETLTRLTEALAAQINSRSKTFLAYKIGEGGGFERLWVTTIEGHTQPFTVSIDYAGQAKIVSAVLQPFKPDERFVGIAQADGAGQVKTTWLNGPVAVERDLLVPLIGEKSGRPHPHLVARVHWRTYRASGAARADVIIENDWTYEPGPQNWLYDVTLHRDDVEVYSRLAVKHFQHARWHRVIWSEGRAEPGLRHDIRYLLSSGAVPHYDETLAIPDDVVRDEAKRLAESDTGPMGTAGLTTYMPMTGGRRDIGPLPTWAVLYLLTMDPRMKAVLLANADAGGGIPIHYRDKTTELPVSLDDHPGLAMVYGRSSARDALPALGAADTPWSPETSHHPSLFYVPYLVTGDLFYLEEQQFWANWVLGAMDPNYRDGARGLLHANQVRGQAWSLRTLGEAATVTPDAHPLKAYFNAKLTNNINWYLEHWARNSNPADVSKLGLTERQDEPGTMAPWQQDFLFLAVGHLAELGIAGADEIDRWLGRFNVGRWSSEAEGYCRMNAPAYYINVRRKTDHSWIDSWSELYRANWPEQVSCPQGGFADTTPGGYVANAYAMLGLATDLHIAGAAAAFRRLREESPVMLGGFAHDPTFAIVPRADNGAKP